MEGIDGGLTLFTVKAIEQGFRIKIKTYGDDMACYQQAFSGSYSLGIRIPDYFQDISYRHDTSPAFTFSQGDRILKICVLPESLQDREITGAYRYTLMEMKTEGVDDDYQEFVAIHFETDSPLEFEKVIFDQGRLKNMLGRY